MSPRSTCAPAAPDQTTPVPFSAAARDWRTYAAAAGASLASVAAAEAAVQHTLPPSPIDVLLPNQTNGTNSYGLDLDGDALADFNLRVEASTAMSFTSYTTVMRQAALGAIGDNGAVGSGGLVWQLQTSSVISSGLFASAGIDQGIFRQSTFTNSTSSEPSFESGEWGAASSGYLGVRFAHAGNDHFGWIKIATTANANGLLGIQIQEWAYEDVPTGGILVGDTIGQQPATPGDYDRNGTVDAQDYAVWTNTFGSTVVPGSGADGNGDATINAADYAVWRNHAVVGSGAAANAVPEPGAASLGMLALGAAGISALRRGGPRKQIGTLCFCEEK
jgi:hypothetical protein